MKRPVIGITSLQREEEGVGWLPFNYPAAIEKAGGTPLVIPALQDRESIRGLFQVLQGLLLSGGGDPDPFIFQEEPLPGQGQIEPRRDWLELILVRGALERGLPLLGICRGMQVMNLAAGGSLYQDLGSQREGALKHMQEAPRWYPTHGIRLSPGSRLASLLAVESCRVNSFHHQAVKKTAPGLIPCAWARDGVIEGIESPGDSLALGVQWHPEAMFTGDPTMKRLFKGFIGACRGGSP